MQTSDIINIKPNVLEALPYETIRYDADAKGWIVLDTTGKQPTKTGEVLERAVLLDVEFSTMTTTVAGSGCGSPNRKFHVGFAKGKIIRNKVGKNTTEWTQFNFNGSGSLANFTCAVSGNVLNHVFAVRIMPERKAVYIP